MNTNQIQECRQKAGISQTKLACKVGIAASTLCNFENGKMEPWPKARKAIAKALGVKESDLFGNKNEVTDEVVEAPSVTPFNDIARGSTDAM